MNSRWLSPARPGPRALSGMDPWSDLQREMSRLMDDVLGGAGLAGSPSTLAIPRVDVRENPKELCVCAELPGVKPEAVDIRLEGNLLTIRGEKRQEAQQEKEDYHLMECSYGRFQRSIQLPYAPSPDEVRADFKDGVLTIHVPKSEHQERSRRIEIQAAGGSGLTAETGPQDSTGTTQH